MCCPAPAGQHWTVMDDDEYELILDENLDWGGEEDDGEELQEEFS